MPKLGFDPPPEKIKRPALFYVRENERISLCLVSPGAGVSLALIDHLNALMFTPQPIPKPRNPGAKPSSTPLGLFKLPRVLFAPQSLTLRVLALHQYSPAHLKLLPLRPVLLTKLATQAAQRLSYIACNICLGVLDAREISRGTEPFFNRFRSNAQGRWNGINLHLGIQHHKAAPISAR
ncbi:MAG: hypothetical protein ACQRW7_06540 [Caulobacterales bacterium]|uniref:hypothetical protein n=1 Tax=Glycocaulis sp. TaxID=1969725 RepID=UPI003FA05224